MTSNFWIQSTTTMMTFAFCFHYLDPPTFIMVSELRHTLGFTIISLLQVLRSGKVIVIKHIRKLGEKENKMFAPGYYTRKVLPYNMKKYYRRNILSEIYT